MVRRFENLPVPAETITVVLNAAVRAPTAGFTQGISYQLLADAEVRLFWATTSAEVEPNAWLEGLRTAPVLVLVWTSEQDYLDRYARPDKGWTDRDLGRWSAPYWWVDAGMGVMAALLAAVDQGLGGCFFGVPPDRIAAVRTAFGVPAEQASVGVVALGHPAQVPTRSARSARSRRRVVHHGQWTS